MVRILLLKLASLLLFCLCHKSLFCVYRSIWHLFLLLPVTLIASTSVLLLRTALHLYSKQFSRSPYSIFPVALTFLLSTSDCLPFHNRGPAIEDEDGTDPEIQQLAYAAKESNDVRISERIAFFVSHRFQKLIDPDRRVDR